MVPPPPLLLPPPSLLLLLPPPLPPGLLLLPPPPLLAEEAVLSMSSPLWKDPVLSGEPKVLKWVRKNPNSRDLITLESSTKPSSPLVSPPNSPPEVLTPSLPPPTLLLKLTSNCVDPLTPTSSRCTLSLDKLPPPTSPVTSNPLLDPFTTDTLSASTSSTMPLSEKSPSDLTPISPLMLLPETVSSMPSAFASPCTKYTRIINGARGLDAHMR
mmetsp:Transcript_23568/g.48924  ORF Transcript_23568/g.48924 Transcript_23568/m.48924 type:complete len:213 (+) Transcript_23568:110-748(+)